MRKTALILSVLLALILLYQCTRHPLTPDGIPAGYKKISLSSAESFQGDLGHIPGFQEFYTAMRSMPDSNQGIRSAKAQALIQFKEARVMVVNCYNEQLYFNNTPRKDDFYCELAQANANAFSGKQLDRWDDLVAGMSQYGFLDLVYTGTLEKDGNYVTGDVLVKPGLNTVIVCFINDAGKIFWSSYAEYLYVSDLYHVMYPADTSTVRDGWLESYMHRYQPTADSFWLSEAYRLEPYYSSDSCYVPAFSSYYLPGLSVYIQPRGLSLNLGIPQAYADYVCGACVDTSRPVQTRSWKDVGGTGVSLGAATLPDLCFSTAGNGYIAYRDAGQANRAMVQAKYGANLVSLGAVSPGAVGSMAMALNNDTPYVAYTDSLANRRVTVKRWDAARSAWQVIGVPSFTDTSANELAMAVRPDSGYVYVAYSNTRANGALTVRRFNRTTWDTVGMATVTMKTVSKIALAISPTTRNLYVGFRDEYNGGLATVMTYPAAVGANWLTVGSQGFSGVAINALDLSVKTGNSDTPYVALDGGGYVTVQKYTGITWLQVGTAVSYAASGGISLSLYTTQCRVALSDGSNGYRASVYEFMPDSSRWTTTGVWNSISSSSIGHPSLAHDNIGTPYLAFQDSGTVPPNRLSVKYYGY